MEKWQSADKVVTKEVLAMKDFTDKPTERAVCQIKIGEIHESQLTVDELRNKFASDIIYGTSEKTWTLGDSCTELDRQIERAIPLMFIDETSLITVKLVPEDESEHENIVKFELTLVNFEPFKPIWQWTPEEKYAIALKYKEFGVKLFKAARYVDAFHKFSKACKILITLEPVKDLELEENLLKDIQNLRTLLYNNIAECHLHRDNYEHVITLCNKVLDRDGNNVKALYRRGLAYGHLKDLEKSLQDLNSALKLEPNDSLVKAKFHFFKQQAQVENKKYEDLVKRMFDYEK